MQNNLLIKLNGITIEKIDWSFNILQLCENINVSIPRFCYHRDLTVAGNCRMCMVEVKNSIKPVISCATSINNNMEIFTNSELVKISRENVLEFLLINHPLDCPICDQGGECDLQDQTMIFGGDRGRFKEIKRSVKNKYFGPIVKTIMTRCIHCTRCVRFSEEIIGYPVLGTMGRGGDTEISTYKTELLKSELIGNIVDLCPVGALTMKPYSYKARPWELEHMETFDLFDSLVSNIRVDIKGNELMRVLPRRNDKINKEWITDKVRFYYQGVEIDRLLFPLLNIKDSNSGMLVNHISMNYAINIFIKKYIDCLLKKETLISYIGGTVDVIDIIYTREFMNFLGIELFYIDQLKKKTIFNIRYDWLLNDNIVNFTSNENFIFLNINLKYECSVLNALISLNINEMEKVLIYYIGFYFNNIYNMIHLCIGINNALILLKNGKHFFCFYLNNIHFNFVESSVQAHMNMPISTYIYDLNNYTETLHSFSHLATNSTELNIYEIGVSNETIENKKYSFFYFVGNNNKLEITLPNSDFYVYQSHSMPENYNHIAKYNLFLPVVVFHEISSFENINSNSGWLNNQLLYNHFIDKLITPPGESKTHLFYYFNILSFFNKNILNNLMLFAENIYNLFGFHLLYKNEYIVTNNVFRFFFNYSININISNITSDTYYSSDVFSRKSVTLLTSKKNNIDFFYKNYIKR